MLLSRVSWIVTHMEDTLRVADDGCRSRVHELRMPRLYGPYTRDKSADSNIILNIMRLCVTDNDVEMWCATLDTTTFIQKERIAGLIKMERITQHVLEQAHEWMSEQMSFTICFGRHTFRLDPVTHPREK